MDDRESDGKMRYPKILIIGLAAYCILFMGATIFHPFHYDDPDSYYYDSISKHIEKSDGTVLGDILYRFGSFWGSLFIFSISVICAGLLFIMMSSVDYKLAQYGTLFFLFSPLMLFNNSWLARMDKNMLEVLFFLVWIQVQSMYRDETQESPVWMISYAISTIVLYIVAINFWQGSILFLMMSIMYVCAYESIIMMHKKNWYVIITGVLAAVIITWKFLPSGILLVAEGQPDIMHYLFPEVIIFITLFFIFMPDLFRFSKSFTIICLVELGCLVALPRTMLFIVPLTAMIFTVCGKRILASRYLWYPMTALIIFFVVSAGYFMTDHHQDIKEFGNPCEKFNVTGCIIVTDWSMGHIYRNIWNESVMFIGHPNQPHMMLDYLYYKNRTCNDCVYLWHPRDYKILQGYVDKLGLPSVNQTVRDEMYAEPGRSHIRPHT